MLFAVLLCFGFFLEAESCSPPFWIPHPQNDYCKAKNVVLVEILSMNNYSLIIPGDIEYRVRVQHIFKGKADIDSLENKERIFTFGYLNSCGPMILEVGQRYILEVSTYSGYMTATYFGVYLKLSDENTESDFRKRIQAYDCSCQVLLEPLTDVPGGVVSGDGDTCPMVSPCKRNNDYCAKESGKCTWKCF